MPLPSAAALERQIAREHHREPAVKLDNRHVRRTCDDRQHAASARHAATNSHHCIRIQERMTIRAQIE